MPTSWRSPITCQLLPLEGLRMGYYGVTGDELSLEQLQKELNTLVKKNTLKVETKDRVYWVPVNPTNMKEFERIFGKMSKRSKKKKKPQNMQNHGKMVKKDQNSQKHEKVLTSAKVEKHIKNGKLTEKGANMVLDLVCGSQLIQTIQRMREDTSIVRVEYMNHPDVAIVLTWKDAKSRLEASKARNPFGV